MMTMLIPAVSQLPLFVGFSVMLNRLSQYPTVFDSESFLTLTSLAHADPTLTLPIVIGLLSLANTESSRWFISEAALQREARVKEWADKRRAKGETVLEPKKIIQSTLRLYSIARILISALFPGVSSDYASADFVVFIIRIQSVQLYWATSAAFGLVQTWTLDFWDARRIRPSSPSKASPATTTAKPKKSK